MKRDPEKARAWLQRSQATAAARARAKPRTRIAPRSVKMTAAYDGPDGRRALVARMLAEAPRCQLRITCSGAQAVDVHERLTRARGGDILDPAQAHMVTTCRPCHAWVDEWPKLAEARGALLPSWHRCPPVGPC